MNKLTVSHQFSQTICAPCIQRQQRDINAWLKKYEAIHTPLYTSVDIRDAGFKIAIVDTNLFPAGFNNLCEHGMADAVQLFKNAIIKRVPLAKKIIIAAEEHTRRRSFKKQVLK
jgi:glutamate--cysteine ligase